MIHFALTCSHFLILCRDFYVEAGMQWIMYLVWDVVSFAGHREIDQIYVKLWYMKNFIFKLLSV